MRNLFTFDRQFEPIALPNADMSIRYEIEMPLPYDQIMQKLSAQTQWRQEAVTVFGKVYDQPRLVSLYGDGGMTYEYAGLRLHPLPWTDLLRDIKRRIEDITEMTFNAVFLNLYRDHNDSMGFHSDDEKELGKNPAIASLTFGAARIFRMKHKFDKEIPVHKITLTPGTLLVMKGETQHFWKHGINKQTQPCGPRINLTFRTLS